MSRRTPAPRRLMLLLVALVAAMALAACGSSSSSSSSSENAQTLLKQTFSGTHTVKSGVLDLGLSFNPSGSNTLTSPVTVSIHGPFQSRGSGNLPASDFTLAGSAMGHQGSLGVVSTGTAGYVTLQGTGYQLPQAEFQKLESSFSSVDSSGSSSSGGLSKFGINPLHWIKDPSVVGTENIGGTDTTHIHGTVDVAALVSDLNTFLSKKSSSSSATSKLPAGIPAATQAKIAQEIKNASLDVWTGNSDKTLRKLALQLTVPVTGRISTTLGGLSSAGLGLTLQYSDLNQPQTISAPTSVKPYSQFQTKLQGLLQLFQSALSQSGIGGTSGSSAGSSGSSAGSSGSATGTTSTPSAGTVNKYSQCIENAGSDVTKMQKCASLLDGGAG
ncbi:MAG: hypothetical protein WAK93_18505 [Solirubrobacteraceae bacterium]